MSEIDDLNRRPALQDRDYFSYERDTNDRIAKRVKFLEIQGTLANKLKFWEMKGLTLTDIENTYNFDFVVTEECIPVIYKDEFVIVER